MISPYRTLAKVFTQQSTNGCASLALVPNMLQEATHAHPPFALNTSKEATKNVHLPPMPNTSKEVAHHQPLPLLNTIESTIDDHLHPTPNTSQATMLASTCKCLGFTHNANFL